MNKFLFLIFLITLTPLQSIASPLRVGMELSYPPFEMTNTSNEPEGISVEMARALSQKLGRRLEIINISFDGLIPSLKTGKIDLIISSMTITEERAKAIDFSIPYVTTGLAILARQSAPIKSYLDLDQAGLRIAVKKGTTAHNWANKNLKKSQILLFDKESNAVLEVQQAKTDAFIYDQLSIYRNWHKNQASTKAILEPFQKESWGIGIAKGQELLKTEVNTFIEEYKKQGLFDKLASKYLSEAQSEFKKMNINFIF